MQLNMFGYIVLGIGVCLLIATLFGNLKVRDNAMTVGVIVLGIGFLLAVGAWWAAHYYPAPGSAGVMLKFDDDAETELQLETLTIIAFFCIPLALGGIGILLRRGLTSILGGKPSWE